MKKVGKTTRPFRDDLNQVPYDYTVEVRNRFKGLDLIDRVPDELWNEVCDIVQETGIKTIPIEKKCKKAKWLSEEALQIAVKRREVKSKGEKERYKHLNAEFQRIARRDKKAFFSDQCKEIEENNRMAKTNRVLPRKCTGHSKHPLPTTQEKTLHMDITRWSTPSEIRLIIFFAAKDGETLYSQQKQDWELTVAQIMNSLLPNSDLS